MRRGPAGVQIDPHASGVTTWHRAQFARLIADALAIPQGAPAPVEADRHLNGRSNMPLGSSPPPRDSRFGSPLKLSRVHWVRPERVVEVTYLTWTEDNLLRQVSYQGQRGDKLAGEVVRPVPHRPRR